MNRIRYSVAKKTLDDTVQGTTETLEAQQVFDVVFINPPYNLGTDFPLEYEHVRQAQSWVGYRGCMIAVLPKSILKTTLFWTMWGKVFDLRNTKIFKMIGPDYGRFGQFIIAGKRLSYNYNRLSYRDNEKANSLASSFDTDDPDYPDISTATHLWHLDRVCTDEIFLENRVPRAGELATALLEKYGNPFKTSRYLELTQPPKARMHQRPAAPTRKTHVVQRAAAGAITGEIVRLWDKDYLLTGNWRKYVTETMVKGDGKDVANRKIETQNIAYQIQGLCLEDGHLFTLDSAREQDAYEQFMNEHVEDLMIAVDASHPPRYNWDYSKYTHYFDCVRSPRMLKGVAGGLFTAQKHVAASILDLFNSNDGNPFSLLVGEMGTGKTIVSIATMAIQSGMFDIPANPPDDYHYPKVVVMSPAVVAPKWCNEVEKILGAVPGIKAFQIGKGRKQNRVAPFRPSSFRHAMVIQEYKALLARVHAGSATKTEKARYTELKKLCVVGAFTLKKRGLMDYKVARVTQRSRYLVEGARLTFKGKNTVENASVQYAIPEYKVKRLKGTRRPIADTKEAMDYKGPAFLIVPFQIAKNGAPWKHSTHKKHETATYTRVTEGKDRWGEKTQTSIQVTQEMTVHYCPSCGQMLRDPETQFPWTQGQHKEAVLSEKTGYKAQMHCNNTIVKGRLLSRPCDGEPDEWETVECNAELYEYEPFAYGGRWPVCAYLKDHYAGKYSTIIDEAHNTKSGDTAIGAASHHLLTGARNGLAMTGTIYNGFARSLFYLLYRMDSNFRAMYAFSEVEQFVQTHGLMETVTTTSSSQSRSSHYGGYNSKSKTYTKEIPGASPELIALMVPITVFLRLADVGFELPEKVELAVPVPMADDFSKTYRGLMGLRSDAAAQFIRGKRGPLALWHNAALAWPDCPKAEEIQDLGSVSAVTMPAEGYAKDAYLVNLVESEQSEGRGVAIFVEQVHKRDPRPRIKALLAQRNIHAEVLESSVPGDERMDVIRTWCNQADERGTPPVFITNGSLVKEGLDLLEFPTIVEVGQHYNVTELRQRLARSWRIGQTKKVRLYFMYYEDSYQEDALAHIANKLRAMDQVNGDVPAGISRFKQAAHDFMQQLLQSAENVDRISIADLMQTADFVTSHIHSAPIVQDTAATVAVLEAVEAVCDLFKVVDTKQAGVAQLSFF